MDELAAGQIHGRRWDTYERALGAVERNRNGIHVEDPEPDADRARKPSPLRYTVPPRTSFEPGYARVQERKAHPVSRLIAAGWWRNDPEIEVGRYLIDD